MDYKLEYKPVGFGEDPESGEPNQGLTGTFVIPDYQRGYRWRKDDVHKLLKDISDSKTPYYSLQPIVVKKRENGYWELIDGQQRLTTLWLIFNYMHKNGYPDFRADYHLEYETRPGSRDYLQTLDAQQAQENIDYFHLRAAHDAIAEWFEANTNNSQSKGSRITKIYRYLADSVRIIWYEVPEREKPIPLFTRLNQGRIPLTDAELLKAVLLTHVAKSHKGREAEIAAQWDGMERDLQRPEVWAFVAGAVQDDERYGTRISLLFDTLAQRKKPDGNRSQPYFTFDTLREQAEDQGGLTLWRDVVALHAQILGWFEEPRRYYNKIGFLVNCGVPIGEIQRSALEVPKKAFDVWLTGKIRSQLNISSDALDEDLRYDNAKHASQLQRLLLLFNVEICSERFPFEKHVDQDWTLEHIHAQNAQSLTRAEQWKDWLTEHRQALPIIQTEKNATEIEALLAQIKAAIPAVQDRGFGERFNALAARIQTVLTPNDEGTDHTIANLALLSHGANAALSNGVFEVKRQKVVEMDKEGGYIPAATRNVFLKYYTDASKLQPHFWGNDDKAAYLSAIKEKLKSYR